MRQPGGRVAVVTGAASGIGLALAERFDVLPARDQLLEHIALGLDDIRARRHPTLLPPPPIPPAR